MRRLIVQSRAAILMLIIALAAMPVRMKAADDPPLAEHPDVAAALKILDAWIQTTIADREQPGLSIGIVYDQELIWSKGYGYADVAKRIPATPQTAYRIASISKLFTATAIMQLRDAGKLQLDDPVAKHLSWFKPKNMHPQGPVITVRHLLTHTSGLPRESPVSYWNDLNFPTRDEMIRMLAEQETVFPAETEWKYSNLAYALAGEVVEAVSGEPYARYVENHILKPLGMNSTRVLPERAMQSLAAGYGRRVPNKEREVEGFTDTKGISPAASLASTVEDLAKFISLQLRDKPTGGAQILKGSTLREMHRIEWLRPDWQSGQGLGFAIRRVGNQVRVGHGGSVPGHRTQIEFAPADKLGIIVLTNANDGDPVRYVNQAFTILNPAIARATEKPKKTLTPDPAWEKYVGTYTWKNSDVQVMILNGELLMIVPGADNPWESRVRLAPAGEHKFRMTGGSSSGELLKFEVDSSGRVTRMTAGSYYYLRKQ